MPEREILLTQTLFCLQSNQNWPQYVPVFQSSVTEHVGVVMGNDCGLIWKVLKSMQVGLSAIMACSGGVGCGSVLQVGRTLVRFPVMLLT
jgi:hypothetical protein